VQFSQPDAAGWPGQDRGAASATSNGKNHLQADQLREDGFRSLMCDVLFLSSWV
jgi:hypothetical protein